jgi:hypothetical protein
MRKRGAKYWLWSDCQLQSTTRRLEAHGDIHIEIRARSSRQSVTQLFVGVYQANGLPLAEEYYAHCPDESVSQALEWGERRGYFLIESLQNERPTKVWPLSERHAANDSTNVYLARSTWSRLTFLSEIQAAQARYQRACREMVTLMKKAKVTQEDWRRCSDELDAAIHHRAAVLRINGRSTYEDYVAAEPTRHARG